MTREILPSSSDGIEETTQKSWTPDRGEQITTIKTGPGGSIDALYAADILKAQTDQTLASLSSNVSKGRGTFTIVKVPEPSTGDSNRIEEDGIQELLAKTVLRDIVLAPYFEDLNYRQVLEVFKAIRDDAVEVDDDWIDLQDTLFHHLAKGIKVYNETAFIFRRSRKVGSMQQVKASMTDINQVTDLPHLATAIRNLIDTLPTGEWLKSPPKLRFLGRDGWEVAEDWQWAPKWSVVYGGTWTGA